MSKPPALLRDLVGIIYARRSPERLPYSRQLMMAAVLLAVSAGVLAHLFLLGLELPFAVAMVVCELGWLVLGLNVAVRRGGRRERVAKMGLALLLISGAGDLVLIALGLAPAGPARRIAAALVVVSQLYGALNCVQFGFSLQRVRALFYVAAWVIGILLTYEIASVALGGLLGLA